MNSAPANGPAMLPHVEDPRWLPYPDATRIIADGVEEYTTRSRYLAEFRDQVQRRTGTRLFDWVDTLHLPEDEPLRATGFEPGDGKFAGCWRHPHALLPALVVDPRPAIYLRVESVVDALAAWGRDIRAPIHGSPTAAIRWVTVAREAGIEVRFVERHGDPGNPEAQTSATVDGATVDANSLIQWNEACRLRRRDYDDDAQGFEELMELARGMTASLGADRACDLFFDTERKYWAGRNEAARVQKLRQDELGLGWANHDHHTYRSSRRHFRDLIGVLELFGMECRERFYAGEQAGWGAQILEQPAARIVVFADVDLGPEELLGDFAHQPLPDRDQLGTVGLWSALHGEAILLAGMHHLECQFDFDAAREQLRVEGVQAMDPFTHFSYLKQAFTEGERWKVPEPRLRRALQHGWITPKDAEMFRTKGAIGSHLEILERNDGYKGFNQTGVSDIIRRTDPRRKA